MTQGSVDPTRPQFEAFKALRRDTPIQMLNLIRLKALAEAGDKTDAASKA